jgi:hypothetical protein
MLLVLCSIVADFLHAILFDNKTEELSQRPPTAFRSLPSLV